MKLAVKYLRGLKVPSKFYLIMKAKVCLIGLQRLSYFDNPFDGFTPGVGFKGWSWPKQTLLSCLSKRGFPWIAINDWSQESLGCKSVKLVMVDCKNFISNASSEKSSDFFPFSIYFLRSLQMSRYERKRKVILFFPRGIFSWGHFQLTLLLSIFPTVY